METKLSIYKFLAVAWLLLSLYSTSYGIYYGWTPDIVIAASAQFGCYAANMDLVNRTKGIK